MTRGAYAYRDLDEEIFAPPECTQHQSLLFGAHGDDCSGYYQSHSSPVQLSKAAKHSEATILRRHLLQRRALRNKVVLVGGIVILLVSTALLCVLSKLPPADKSALELVVGAPYGALRRAGTQRDSTMIRSSASTPVSPEEAAGAMTHKRWTGPGVGDDDPNDLQLDQARLVETDELQREEEAKDSLYESEGEGEGEAKGEAGDGVEVEGGW